MLFPYDLNFPVELKERKTCATFYPCRYFQGLKDASKMFGIFFQDATRKEWIGKISKRDRDLWMKSEPDGWRLEWDPTHEIWIPEPDAK